MHAPRSKVAEAGVEEDVGVAVVVVMLSAGVEVVEAGEAVENEVGNEVVLEGVGDCGKVVEKSDDVGFQ